jgi:hypothetical protein
MKHSIRNHRLALLLSGCLLAGTAMAADDFSPAEKSLFMSRHFDGLKPPAKLNYSYAQSGPLGEPFDDKVEIALAKKSDGQCCTATTKFLTGTHKLEMPEVESAEGNPAILYFLEREVREMSRLTKGQSAYFRKRIRMAIYQGAKVDEVQATYKGKPVAAQQIVIAPYLDDPLRARFEKYAPKQYVFTLSPAVPGHVMAVSSFIAADSPSAPPLLREEMLLDGAAVPTVPNKP